MDWRIVPLLVGLVCGALVFGHAAPVPADDPPAIPAPVRFTGDQGQPLVQVQQGAAQGAGYGSLYVPQGDIFARNLQGTGPSLDIGGGSTERPGAVTINFDVGNRFAVWAPASCAPACRGYRPMLVVDGRGVRARGRDGRMRWIGGAR